MMETLKIKSRIRDYDVYFQGDLSFFGALSVIEPFVCIIDKKVYNLYHDKLGTYFTQDRVFLFDAVEKNKSLDGTVEIYSFLTKRQSKKNLNIIAIGGGITQDIAGFVSSTIFRGVDWYYVPTTLLAQTDSCIGGKTSLNFQSYKNLIGTFSPPREIHIFSGFVTTLEKTDFYSGLGEVIKLQLMKKGPKDINRICSNIERAKTDFQYLQEVIRENLSVKIAYMENDEFDQGSRNLLNYGHCFGHALETVSNYFVPHGIAVIVGMIFANVLSYLRGMMTTDMMHSLNEDILKPNIVIALKRDHFESDFLLNCLKNDKKVTGRALTVVIADDNLCFMKLDNVTEAEFHKSLDMVLQTLF